jgi:hypothetical protein
MLPPVCKYETCYDPLCEYGSTILVHRCSPSYPESSYRHIVSWRQIVVILAPIVFLVYSFLFSIVSVSLHLYLLVVYRIVIFLTTINNNNNNNNNNNSWIANWVDIVHCSIWQPQTANWTIASGDYAVITACWRLMYVMWVNNCARDRTQVTWSEVEPANYYTAVPIHMTMLHYSKLLGFAIFCDISSRYIF